VGYRATGQCLGGTTLKLCGRIALSFDAEWKTYNFVSGFNFVPGQGLESEGGCDDESKLKLNCFGCGDAVLSSAMKKNGYQFARPVTAEATTK
jgi:hypothetical protein